MRARKRCFTLITLFDIFNGAVLVAGPCQTPQKCTESKSKVQQNQSESRKSNRRMNLAACEIKENRYETGNRVSDNYKRSKNRIDGRLASRLRLALISCSSVYPLGIGVAVAAQKRSPSTRKGRAPGRRGSRFNPRIVIEPRPFDSLARARHTSALTFSST